MGLVMRKRKLTDADRNSLALLYQSAGELTSEVSFRLAASEDGGKWREFESRLEAKIHALQVRIDEFLELREES